MRHISLTNNILLWYIGAYLGPWLNDPICDIWQMICDMWHVTCFDESLKKYSFSLHKKTHNKKRKNAKFQHQLQLFLWFTITALRPFCSSALGLLYMLKQLLSSSLIEVMKPGCPGNVESGEINLSWHYSRSIESQCKINDQRYCVWS